MKTRSLTILLLAAMLMSSCGPKGGQTSGIELVASAKARVTSPNVPISDIAALTEGNNAFAFALYQAIRDGDGNLFYSPYSISLALAMTYAGARTETEKQMAEALHYALSQSALHPTFNALDQMLASRGQGAQGKGGQPFRLSIANSIWGQKDYKFLAEFLDTLAVNYGAGLRLLDFAAAPEPAREIINQWVSDETAGKIPDLLPAGSIDGLTRMVLANAIYFNAAWMNPFQEERTEDGAFHLLDGGDVTVRMMNGSEYYRYAQVEGYQAVELPYSGGELSMVILLPDEGKFREFEASLDAAEVDRILSGLEGGQVDLTMPKFKYDARLQLARVLSGMGMPIAFTSDADFSGMDGTRNLSISDVYHKAFVAVDEEGTEAAAATAVVMKLTASPVQPVEVKVDRPFLFLIRDIQTGAILFVGRVMNPA